MSDNILREKIARAVQAHSHVISWDEETEDDREVYFAAADEVLALPEMEALNIEIPDEWPLEGDYGRGWNDCRRHARSIIVRSASPPA